MSATRTSIITATNELFRIHGYNGTTLAQISAMSGATIGSIYHFFPGGKEALTVAVLESTGAIYLELFLAIAAEEPDPTAAFTATFHGAAETLATSDFLDPCPIGTVAREVASTNEPIRQAAKAAFESWITAATEVLSNAGVGRSDAQRLATLFVTTLEGSFVLSRTLRSTDPLRAAADSIKPLIAAVPSGVRANN